MKQVIIPYNSQNDIGPIITYSLKLHIQYLTVILLLIFIMLMLRLVAFKQNFRFLLNLQSSYIMFQQNMNPV